MMIVTTTTIMIMIIMIVTVIVVMKITTIIIIIYVGTQLTQAIFNRPPLFSISPTRFIFMSLFFSFSYGV